MKFYTEVKVNDLYEYSYELKDGTKGNALNLEIANPETRTKYDRYVTFNIDKELWNRLQLSTDNNKAKYIGKNCELVCNVVPYQNLFRVVVNQLSVK